MQKNKKLKIQHYISIIAAALLVIILFVFGKTTQTKKDIDLNQGSEMADNHSHIEPANFDSMLTAAKLKLSPKDQAAIEMEENSITRGDLKSQHAASYERLGEFWLKKNRAIAAFYFAESGKLENSEKKLNFAAHLLSEELEQEEEPRKKAWMTNLAVDAYEQSLKINPNNDTVKMDLALLYVGEQGATMQGIQLLLGIVEKNPNHIPANIVLGRMAVESGQLDKAIERGKHILSIDKDNLEAHLFLGEAYKRNGEKEKAIELFEKAKIIMNNPNFSKDMDDYINSFRDN